MLQRICFSVLMLFSPIFMQAQQVDSLEITNRFELGEIQILSTKSEQKMALRPLNLKLNFTNTAQALNSLAGVNLYNSGDRNEMSVSIRGFNIRNIPVYIDGIPVYVSYDGYIDLGRFKTFDYSLITASSGLTPMEYGANTIGGAINLVTLKPVRKAEVQAVAGFTSGNTYEYGANFGSRLNKLYFLGSLYRLKSDYFNLSNNFQPLKNENGGKRENSWSDDWKINLKAGFTPSENYEFAVNYIYQNGAKGIPPYSGTDPLQTARFWQFPDWDKQSLYFISRIKTGKNSNFKIRLFYDKFYNKLESFDDSTYSAQTKKYAFTSIYNDHSWGGNAVYTAEIKNTNQAVFSVHYKNDWHKEYNVGEPERNFNDHTFSAGIDDNQTLNSKTRIISGLSYNYRKALQADNYDSKTGLITGFPLEGNGAINAQAGAEYHFSAKNKLLVYIAHRTRFATLKDRFSYKMGKAIPNPALKPENALHYNISLNNVLFSKINTTTELYYIQLNNTIQQVDNVQPNISQMQNTGKSVYKGLTFTAIYPVIDWASVSANYALTLQKNISNPDIFFTNIPNHKVWANLKIAPVKLLEFNLNANYNSARYSTTYGTRADSFLQLDLHASISLKHFTIFTGIQNLFDKNYAYTEGFPAPGRNGYIKLLVGI